MKQPSWSYFLPTELPLSAGSLAEGKWTSEEGGIRGRFFFCFERWEEPGPRRDHDHIGAAGKDFLGLQHAEEGIHHLRILPISHGHFPARRGRTALALANSIEASRSARDLMILRVIPARPIAEVTWVRRFTTFCSI